MSAPATTCRLAASMAQYRSLNHTASTSPESPQCPFFAPQYGRAAAGINKVSPTAHGPTPKHALETLGTDNTCQMPMHIHAMLRLQGLPAKSRLQTKVLTYTCTKHPNVDMSLQVEPATPTRRMWLPMPKGSSLRSGCAPSLMLPLSNFSCLALPRSEQSKGPCVTNHILQSHL